MNSSHRGLLFIPAGFFLLMLLLLGKALFWNQREIPSALLNRPLPEFSKPTLDNPNQTITGAGLRGDILIMNVWATWCPPCHAEHPHLVRISENEPDLVFVGVNYKDDAEAAGEFINTRGNPFAYILTDVDGKLGIELGVRGAPETFVVDREGFIRFKYEGAIDENVWQEKFVPVISQLN